MAVKKKNHTLMLKKLNQQVRGLQKKEEAAKNKLRAALSKMRKGIEAKGKALASALSKIEKKYASGLTKSMSKPSKKTAKAKKSRKAAVVKVQKRK